ncbi:MAG: hydrogenase formation protein HypD [Aquabacterium sp.]|jgi:hydrogenase expression/formation protein HypD|uniref:hydrogenase formation protein HypD n=1 Tax=Aquabacterium sp. TaxID=1872578 RepID=UPI002A364952|nr:hydrogenase formation protein HypD [Aquabacterium sp.]MDX9844024.1 hydrogenase formation protein HypD [Aquabacterium sp.]
MKYVSEFRDPTLARHLTQKLTDAVQPGRTYRFMEFCGGHTHALARYGVLDLLPPQIQMIHGPGCPVCVLPIGRIDMAIELAQRPGVILASYGDTLRVPASEQLSLIRARAQGADVRIVYAVDDALALARAHPDREVVFLAIGFETTTPPTAVALQTAQREGLHNFSVLCNHVLTPAAMHAILGQPEHVPLDGLVGPAHVSTIIGSQPYEVFASRYDLPVVIAGFEPLDMMQAILMLVQQVNEGRAEVENEFTRAVSRQGNTRAQALVHEVFELRDDFAWRGLDRIPHSALRLRPAYARFDAEQRFGLHDRSVPDHPQCLCGPILRGQRQPVDCKLFGSVCTPDNPMGACMVSSEGACAAHYAYGRHRAPTAALVSTAGAPTPASPTASRLS